MMKPSDALKAAKQLTGQWPHARPPNAEMWLSSIAAVLAQYPSAIVEECIDPRRGLARAREFPPTIAIIVEWCDAKLKHYQLFAEYKPRLPPPPEPEFSDEHRIGMLARLQKLMHDLVAANKDRPWVRPVGVFEHPNDRWNDRRRPVPAKGAE